MNIFISNLSFRINNDDLTQLFEEYGEVTSSKVIMDKITGKSRGFGFVEMKNDAEARKAIEELDKAEYDGKEISVSVARPRTEGGSGKGNSGSYERKNHSGGNRNNRY